MAIQVSSRELIVVAGSSILNSMVFNFRLEILFRNRNIFNPMNATVMGILLAFVAFWIYRMVIPEMSYNIKDISCLFAVNVTLLILTSFLWIIIQPN